MIESDARDEICRVGKSLFERGYVHATAGNISVRLDDGFLITPTDACLGFLQPQQLAKVGLDGLQRSGEKASKTLALHRRIYESTSGFSEPPRCVIHTHSTHCVALTLEAHGEELLPAITPYFVMKVGHVPVVPYHRPGDPAAAEWVAQAVARYAARGVELRAVVLERLGPNAWHSSPAQAMAVLEELEETARLWSLNGRRATPLGADQIDQLRSHFGASW
jgi:ribulose-5-phosphate 4-epimerase/fuculose-1-phosphate aldolase